ncbi:thyroid receptor-interacting protein 6-like [Limulus polyphemus]|uniref:Thyroid receptor-interacting protein 6-like n=1 Tax=Limulus polyphemus TaxID=6850 RepID=A0ABM1C4V9_LIMPO|nr:thyroid receptor-interacting protein 6-like [Limulus polyphemus]XP_022237493.1 thyroid receptor-interacting protein 6-like [Limulus polyphemus]XP_022237494.1 thyroid receptor-interacting protein 6-like [Limulus polyphemus]
MMADPLYSLEDELTQLNLTSCNRGNYPPSQEKKIAPAVPPKPVKKLPENVYVNIQEKSNNQSGLKEIEFGRPTPLPTVSPVYSNIPNISASTLSCTKVDGDKSNQSYNGAESVNEPEYMNVNVTNKGTKDQTFCPASKAAISSYPGGSPPHSPSMSNYGSQSIYSACRPQSSASNYDTDSIYEPITPRPPSQMSSRSTYSMGSGGSSLYSSYYPALGRNKAGSVTGMQSLGRGSSTGQESEVDQLTDLLVQSMDSSRDSLFFGTCHKCGEKVLGEGSGCSAMDQLYHISCFTCSICQIQLQGKSFFAMDGQPYCEADYLNTLEKCCVCQHPILDRILRATGKPYHPGCFTCVVCGICLDGIPFTVDAHNQIHCIEDFQRKFAPRCCVCKGPIMPEQGEQETVRVVALDRSFHVKCYRCEDCGVQLSSEAEGRGCFPLDDHILCRGCNAQRVQALTSSIAAE